jgi:aspartyl-tRNA(Asn)/glutamyl-tRNA(Gln) amidotransferase subunit C
VSISDADVRHIATLARLGLDDARIPSLVAELNGILAHMDVLQRVALPSSGDAGDAREAMPLREDRPVPAALEGARASFAPEMRDGFFLVPRVASHGTGSVRVDGPADETVDDS